MIRTCVLTKRIFAIIRNKSEGYTWKKDKEIFKIINLGFSPMAGIIIKTGKIREKIEEVIYDMDNDTFYLKCESIDMGEDYHDSFVPKKDFIGRIKWYLEMGWQEDK
jgi:hypothetical protein